MRYTVTVRRHVVQEATVTIDAEDLMDAARQAESAAKDPVSYDLSDKTENLDSDHFTVLSVRLQ